MKWYFFIQFDHKPESLKAELRMIQPLIEELRKRKNARKNQVSEVLTEMQSIKNEICISNGVSSNEPITIEPDLSIKKLEELHRDLRALQMEKVCNFPLLHLKFNFNYVFSLWYIL